MKRRRDGLIGFPGIARMLGKSLSYVYWLSSMDPTFPPVETRHGPRKLFAASAVEYYRNHVRRRWYRTTPR
jgi:hypothetical protein